MKNVLYVVLMVLNSLSLAYMIGITVTYFLQLLYSGKALNEYVKYLRFSDYRRYIDSANMIPVSLIVPAYNEEQTVIETVKNLLKLNYPEYEIIVVNDGGTDGTLSLLLEQFSMVPIEQPFKKSVEAMPIRGVYRTPLYANLIVLDKENGGKADALNAGINFARYPVVVSMDADSVLEKEALVRIVTPFLQDSTVVAVGGVVRIANGCVIQDGEIKEIRLPRTALGKLQTVEYLRSFFTGRIGAASMGMLLIISGAFGAFRKDAVVSVGGYTTNCIGEDMELVVKLHRGLRDSGKPYRIDFLPDPICWTQPPENLRDLYKQRKRWQIGLINVLMRHKDMAFNPKYGKAGLLMLPYYWIFEFIGPIFETMGYFVIPLSWWLDIISWKFALLFFLLVVMVGLILSLGAILQESYAMRKFPKMSQVLTLAAYALVDNFGFRQFNTLIRFIGCIKYRSGKNSWGTMKREKFVSNS
ncbi:MAG: glycosyltransferase [Candidatus Limiplasma sp.]|nr:glycosyltransferase [Candidatus Limiplasma sp.]MEA5146457.1 glycosyltransferase [Candidatus Limiplasma sp.]